MYYIIRFILITLLIVLPAVYINHKFKKQKIENNNIKVPAQPKKIKKRQYVYYILSFLILFILYEVCSYPFEKYFLTFSSEKSAFDYICKDISNYERFEYGDAIFYVERSENTDTIYSIAKIGDRYSYVNNQSECTEYQEYNYRNARFDVIAMYNETANVSLYNVVVRNQPYPDNHNATMNDNNITYASSVNKVWFNTQRKANCYYYMDTAAPIKEITVKVSNACGTLKKPNVKHWFFVTFSDFSNSND